MVLFSTRKRALALPLLAMLALGGAGSARADDISFLDAFKNLGYLQTGNGNSLIGNGDFFSSDLNEISGGGYSSVTMSYPGSGSPIGLTLSGSVPTDFHYQTDSFASQSDMDAALPFGTYTFTTNNGDSASFQYSMDDYAQSVPYLTGTDYSQLQGMDPASDFTFNFSTFVTGTATASYLFFTIFDETLGQSVYDSGFLPADTTSLTVTGDTLNYGDTYDYEIDFSNRLNVDGEGGEFPPQLGFDTRTDGTFTTEAMPQIVPEPATLLLGGIGSLATAILLRRRRP